LFKVKGEIVRSCEGALVTDDRVGRQADWRAIFGNDRPVQIEIGPGKGTALIHLAELFAGHNFLGIEWANAFYRRTARRMTYWGISNVKMLRTDAREFIIDRVAPASVFAVHIYFPDPWPKHRHAGRRLFIPEFCRALVRVLVPGGKALVATDHDAYFTQIRNTLGTIDRLGESDPFVLGDRCLRAMRGNYEAKFLGAGRRVFRIAVEKK